jgi:uncharacterized membrane protein YeaQ/YmgE (transglycosylase-associated protein family)
MTLLELIIYLVIAAICGAIARAVAGGTGRGFILSVLVGFAGAAVGTWLARIFHLPVILAIAIDGRPFPIIWSIIGGILLVAVAHMLMRPSGYIHRYVR